MSLTIREAGTSIEFNEPGATPSTVTGAVQSYNFSYDLRRENLQKLGIKYAYAKEITYPLTVNCSVSANVTDLNIGDLANVICNDKSYDIELNINKTVCGGTGPTICKYRLLNAKLDNTSENMSIGSNKSVTWDFSAQIGSSQQTDKGLFMSGHVGNLA